MTKQELLTEYYTALRRWFNAPKGMKREWERTVKRLNAERLKAGV